MISDHSLSITGDVSGSVLVTGSQNIIIQAGQVMVQAAARARAAQRDPARMLRILALLAAPVFAPRTARNPPRTPGPAPGVGKPGPGGAG